MAVTIRPINEHDLEEIARIDHKLTGKHRIDHWESRLLFAIRRDPEGSWVAVDGDRVVGFLMADVRGEEFGFSEPTGWLEVLAVHPDVQRQDVASHLVKQLLNRLQARGVRDVRTLVSQSQEELRQFFAAQGFEAEPVAVYHRRVEA